MDREARKYRKTLQDLSNAVLVYLDEIDRVMRTPTSQERGKQIALLTGKLEFANDQVRYFSLGVDFRKDNKKKALAKVLAAAGMKWAKRHRKGTRQPLIFSTGSGTWSVVCKKCDEHFRDCKCSKSPKEGDAISQTHCDLCYHSGTPEGVALCPLHSATGEGT